MSEICNLLINDKEKRRQIRNHLQKEYKFSKEQAFALIFNQRIGWCISQVLMKIPEVEVNISQVFDQNELDINNVSEGKTIRKMSQRIIWNKLSERDVKVISRTLKETSSDAVIVLSCLSRLQRELRTLNTSEKIISTMKNPKIIKLSNKIQKEHSKQHKNKGFHYLDYFLLESVKERLDEYDVFNISDKQVLADIMIMLYIHPAEIKNLHISNSDVTGYAKN